MNIVNREQKKIPACFLRYQGQWTNERMNEWMNEHSFIHSSYFLNGVNFKPFCYFLIAVTSNLIIKSKHEKDKSRLVTEAILQSLWVSDAKSSPIESYARKISEGKEGKPSCLILQVSLISQMCLNSLSFSAL